MPPTYRVSLSYSNQSLGQMAMLRDSRNGSHLTEPVPPVSKHTINGTRRVVLVTSYERAIIVDEHKLIAVRLLAGLLFSTLDTSIVSTSLVTISNDLNDFTNAPWVVLSYLLTYMGTNWVLIG